MIFRECLWSSFVAGEPLTKNYMTTLTSTSLSRHSRSIESTWLAHSPFVLVWVWPSHAIATLAAILELRSGSHIAGIESPFGYKASTHTFVSQ